MSGQWLPIVIVLAALGAGLMAGIFYAFSRCVMQALGGLSRAEGMTAMKAMNVTILNPLFFVIFFGALAACAVLAVYCLFAWGAPGSGWLLAGSTLYIVGGFLVTVIFNVPMNNALAASEVGTAAGEELWADYLRRWTAWNHVRTAASAAALVCFLLALI